MERDIQEPAPDQTAQTTGRDLASVADRLVTCASAGMLTGITVAIILVATTRTPAPEPRFDDVASPAVIPAGLVLTGHAARPAD